MYKIYNYLFKKNLKIKSAVMKLLSERDKERERES